MDPHRFQRHIDNHAPVDHLECVKSCTTLHGTGGLSPSPLNLWGSLLARDFKSSLSVRNRSSKPLNSFSRGPMERDTATRSSEDGRRTVSKVQCTSGGDHHSSRWAGRPDAILFELRRSLVVERRRTAPSRRCTGTDQRRYGAQGTTDQFLTWEKFSRTTANEPHSVSA